MMLSPLHIFCYAVLLIAASISAKWEYREADQCHRNKMTTTGTQTNEVYPMMSPHRAIRTPLSSVFFLNSFMARCPQMMPAMLPAKSGVITVQQERISEALANPHSGLASGNLGGVAFMASGFTRCSNVIYRSLFWVWDYSLISIIARLRFPSIQRSYWAEVFLRRTRSSTIWRVLSLRAGDGP
jgi:hypothetical protein